MAERRDPETIKNTLERRSALICDMLEDQAKRIVDSMDEPPPGMQEPDSDTVRAMWSFSPYPNPETRFWQMHDALLPNLLAQIAQQPMAGDEQLKAVQAAHREAELQALQTVYPQRVKLVLLGVTTIDRSVELADRAARLMQRAAQQRGEPEAMAYA